MPKRIPLWRAVCLVSAAALLTVVPYRYLTLCAGSKCSKIVIPARDGASLETAGNSLSGVAMTGKQSAKALLLAGGITTLAGQAMAQSSTTVATWIQEGPGSSAAALQSGSYGDQPTSTTPTILARAIITNAVASGLTCPAVLFDHARPVEMKLRFMGSQLTNTPGTPGATNDKTGYPQYFVSSTATAPANFPNGTPMATTSWGECEAVVPAGHKVATIDGVDMKLPVAHPRRILIMADTGCRMNGALAANGSNQQNCADPTAFPWAYLSSYEATFKPDLILQVGDWFYRDTNCLSNGVETFPGCNTPTSPNYEPWGDIFDSWNADVFFPAKTLLASAPWIMARGNHESCGRGARGWYALLDPRPFNINNVICAKTSTYPLPGPTSATYTGDFEPTYVVPANGVNFLVHDSSFANDSAVDPNMAANYDVDLSNLLAVLGPNSMNIFATHKPTFGLSYGSAPDGCTVGKADDAGDFTEQSVFAGGTGYTASAFANGVPSNIGLFVSGHVHQFQYFNFGKGAAQNATLAPQLIVGVGSSLLDPDCITGNVPAGNVDMAAFKQHQFPFEINESGGVVAAQNASTYSHDEFGFAILDAETDKTTGVTTGYKASIYKISSAMAGECKITLNPRSIKCNF